MEIQIIKDWANQNQGLLAIILFLASLIVGWISGLFKWFFGKFKSNTPFISAGGILRLEVIFQRETKHLFRKAEKIAKIFKVKISL